MIEKKTIYVYEGRHFDSLTKAIDAVEDDFCTFMQDKNNLLEPSSRSTKYQIIALCSAMLNNQDVMLRLLKTLEEARWED